MKKFGFAVILVSGAFILAGCENTAAPTTGSNTDGNTKKIFFTYNTPAIQDTQLKSQVIWLSVNDIDVRDVNVYSLDSYANPSSYVKGKSIEGAEIHLDASAGSGQQAILIEIRGESYKKLTLISGMTAIYTSGPAMAVASNRAMVNFDLNKVNIVKPQVVHYDSRIIYALTAE